MFSAIKIGRYSLQRKTNNICFVKTLEGNDESRNGEHSPASSSSSLNSPPTNVKSPHIDVSSPSCSGTAILNQNSPGTFETASPIGSSKYAPPAKKLKLAGEITLTEVDTYVKTLYHAFKCLLEEASVLQQDKLRRDQQQYLVRNKISLCLCRGLTSQSTIFQSYRDGYFHLRDEVGSGKHVSIVHSPSEAAPLTSR